MEKTTYDKIDYLVAKDGILSLRVAAENIHETSYMNKVVLIVVDHPEGTEVLMDVYGIPHTISNVLPVQCVDESGDDCTFEVSARDAMPPVKKLPEKGGMIKDTDYAGKVWEADDRDSMRTWLELTLPETNAKQAKLIVSLSETGILHHAEFSFFKLAEGKLNEVYSLLDSTILGDFLGYRVYEVAALKIQILENGVWVDYPDPELKKNIEVQYDTMLYPLDMSLVQGNKLRLSFWAPAYMIDYIGVDFSHDKEVTIHELSAEHELLSFDDGQYLVMETGDYVDLNFRVPEKNGEERTYFASSTGYYHPLEDLMEEDVEEPLDLLKADIMYRMIFEEGYAEEYLFETYTRNTSATEEISQAGSILSLSLTALLFLIILSFFYIGKL
jgi:hypothetical protein